MTETEAEQEDRQANNLVEEVPPPRPEVGSDEAEKSPPRSPKGKNDPCGETPSSSEGQGASKPEQHFHSGRDFIYPEWIEKFFQGDFHQKFIFNSGVKQEDSEEPNDLSLDKIAVRLTSNGDIKFPPDNTSRDLWASELSRKGLLVLSSYDRDVLFCAALTLAASPKFSDYQVFMFRWTDCKWPLSHLAPLLRRSDTTKPALVLAEASNDRARCFLDPVIGDATAVEMAKGELQDDRLVILTNDRTLGWQADPKGHQSRNQYMPYYSVPFLRSRLHTALRSGEMCADLHDEIQDQFRKGLWGDGEEQLFELVSGYLGHGCLVEEVEKRRQAHTRASLESAKEIRADRMISPRTPLENAVLFLATFFPDLPMHDFQRLLLNLLGEEVQKTKSSSYVLSPDGGGSVEEIIESRLLQEIWTETYPEVLARCHLVSAWRSEDASSVGAPVVQFSIPGLRQDLRRAFTGPHYPIFSFHLQRVRKSRLLADRSPEVIDATVRLLVDTALANPGEFSAPGLGGVVASKTEDFPAASLDPLLRSFLQEPALRDSVARFFQELLADRRYGFLFALLRSLWSVPDFQAARWLRRIFDEGADEGRERIYSRMLQAAHSGMGSQIISAVAEWMPDPGAANASFAGKTAAVFLVDLHELSLFRPDRSRRAWPPTHPALAAASREGGAVLLPLVIRSLLHPALAPILCEQFEDHWGCWIFLWMIPDALHPLVLDEIQGARFLQGMFQRWLDTDAESFASHSLPDKALFFPAAVFADWAVELLCDASPAEARVLFEQALVTVAQKTDARQRRLLANLWCIMEESLLDLLVFLEELDPRPIHPDQNALAEIRKNLQARRRCIKQLRVGLQAGNRPSIAC